MSLSRKLQEMVHTLEIIPQQVIRFISGAVTRIFGPTDDDYPATGAQPFEGEPADKKLR
ncbi:MAG: hypothetical protein ACAF41_04795 [Leptolyngbya sp. BL-A-14]